VLPSVKEKVELELVQEYGAHPEIRVDGKRLSVDYSDFEALKKTLVAALGKAK
jgi:hypothetical protein